MASNEDESSSDSFTDNHERYESERDLYAILCISKDADSTTIQQAYRRLTLLYHPDKHTDPRNKQLAMDLFIQVKNAYDILNDPEKRAIYDVVGIKGIRAEGWEIITRTKSAREIFDEYERLTKEREERRFNQVSNANGSVNGSFNLTDIFNQLNSKEENGEFSPHIEMTEFSVEQGIDIPLNSQDTVTINAAVTTRNGGGAGSLSTSFRRILPDLSWFRVDLTYNQRPLLGVRYFRRITQKLQASVSTNFGLIKGRRAIATPGLIFSVNYQLTQRLSSGLQWKAGRDSFMKGSLHYDNQKWAISSALQLGLVNTFGAIDTVYRFPNICNLRFSMKLFLFGPWIEYGIDRQLTKHTQCSATVAISTRMGVLLRLKFNRGSQSFTIPLHFSQEILPSSIFYATVVPVLGYFILDRMILKPFARSEDERQEKKRTDEAREKQTERRREAMNAQEVLRSMVEQIKEQEGPQGLIVLEGLYGHLISRTAESSLKIIDVTIPLQALVKNSTLKIDTTTSKSNLTGFYDPCLGEEKSLFVKYSFRSQIHTVTYRDIDPIVLPNREHLVS